MPIPPPHRIRIIVQRADRMGDMIVALPTIEAIAAHYPDARIDVLASSIGAKVLEQHPKINAIIEAKWTSEYNLKNKGEIQKKLQKGCYDLYIGLWDNLTLAWMACKARIPIRIADQSRFPNRILYTHTVDAKPNLITQHQIKFNLRHLAPLGISMPETPITQLYISPEATKNISIEFQKYYRSRVQWLAICVASGGSSNPIPENAIIDLITMLDPEEWNIILIGPNESSELLKRLPNPNIIKLFGRPLEQVMAAIEYCTFYIGPDTGITHMASFLKKPMIQVTPMPQQFPGRWAPLSPYFEIIRKEYQYCHHSPKKQCGSLCLKYITGDLLYQTLDTLIYKVNIKEPVTKETQKDQRLIHTFRTLVIAESEFDFLKYKHLCQYWEEAKFIMIPLRIPQGIISSAWVLIQKCMQHNITIIHGNVHPVTRWIVRTVIDKIVQYVKPVFTSQLPITEHIDIHDYLRHYDSISKQQFDRS